MKVNRPNIVASFILLKGGFAAQALSTVAGCITQLQELQEEGGALTQAPEPVKALLDESIQACKDLSIALAEEVSTKAAPPSEDEAQAADEAAEEAVEEIEEE